MKRYFFKIIEKGKRQQCITNRSLNDQELSSLDDIRQFYMYVIASTEEEAWDRLDQYFVYWPSSRDVESELLMAI